MIKQSIPDVGFDVDSHTRALKSIKEAVEVSQRLTVDTANSFVTVGDLVDLRLLTLQGKSLVAREGSFVEPALLNSWVQTTGDASKFGAIRDPFNRVYLQGAVQGGFPSPLAVLPKEYRPRNRSVFVVRDGTDFGVLEILTGGTITLLSSAGAGAAVSLDGVNFLAVQ